MRERCNNPNYKRFSDYGGRGITVCRRWSRFQNFLSDMGPRPVGHTLDRINNEGNYEPGNCRWATPKTQARNARSVRVYEFRGVVASIAEHCERLGLNSNIVHGRISVNGWTITEALSLPILPKGQRCRPQFCHPKP